MANNKDFKVKNGIQPTVYHEGLGTVVSGSEAYSIAGASYDSVSFDVSSQGVNPTTATFKPDGTKMYYTSNSTDTVYQYSLSTAWDISTASYDSVSFSVTTQAASPNGSFFSADGTAMFICDQTTQTIYQYTLSTAWDLSTASYASKSLDTTSIAPNPRAIYFVSSGTVMIVQSGTNDAVYEYGLSTAYDISTATYNSKTFSVTSQANNPWGVEFNSDGTKMFVGDLTTDTIYQYNLSTAYDITTSSYSGTSFYTGGEEVLSFGFIFGNSGQKLYVTGVSTGEAIYQYSTVLNTASLDLSTGSVFDLTPTSDVQVTLSNPAASGTVSQATLLLDGGGAPYALSEASHVQDVSISTQTTDGRALHFSSDGTKMYVVSGGFDIYLYDLSTAWDASTAVYDQTVNGQSVTSSAENRIGGLFLKADGTSYFAIGGSTNKVYKVDLSTAWDLSTGTLDTSFTVTDPSDIANYPNFWFSGDGTKMILVDTSNRTVYGYDLSTAWDISTASHDSNTYNADAESTNDPAGLWLNPEGTKLWLAKDSNVIYQYSLSTAFDVSTMSYDNVSFSVSSQTTSMSDIFFTPLGKMYVLSTSAGTVDEYDTISGYTITYSSTLEWPSGTAPTSPAIGETDVLTFSTTDGGTSYQAVQAIDGAS